MRFEPFAWGKDDFSGLMKNPTVRGALLVVFAILLGTTTSFALSSWTPVSTPAGATKIDGFDINQSNNHWFISDRTTGVWKSTNQGATWTQINSGLPTNTCSTGNVCGWTIQYDPHDQSLILCIYGSPTHFYKSTDEATWTQIPEPAGFSLNSSNPPSAGSYDGGLMPNSGGTTEMLLGGIGCSNANLSCVVMYSTTDGRTTNSASTSPAQGKSESFGVNGSAYGLGGEAAGFFTATDGHTFTAVWNCAGSVGPSCGNTNDSNEIYTSITDGHGNWMLATMTGVFRSSGPASKPTGYTHLYTSSQRSRTLFMDSLGNFYYGQAQTSSNATVRRSTDGGATWLEYDTGIGTGLEAHKFVQNTNDGNLYALIENGSGNAGFIYRIPLGQGVVGPPTSNPPQITTSPLLSETVGQSVLVTMSAQGGVPPYTWSTTGGSFPPGSTMNTAGVISGTPTTSGTYAPTIQVKDSASSTASGTLSIIVSKSGTTPPTSTTPPPTGTSSIAIQLNLPLAHIGAAYSASASASGGVAPYQYSIVQGALPNGVVINGSTGSIAGIPTIVGTFSFQVAAVDANGNQTTHSGALSVLYPSDKGIIGVGVAVSPISGAMGSGKTLQFTSHVTGTSLKGVKWSASAGTISNAGLFTAPTVSGTTTVTITVTSVADTTKTSSATMSITSGGGGSGISVAVSPLTANVASGSNQQFTATVQGTSNTAVTWSASSGTISIGGLFTAPAVSSTTNVSVTATSSADTTKKSTAIVNVIPGATGLAVTTPGLPGATSGSAYSYLLSASGGSSPYQWTVASGSLPTGFSLTSGGQLSGTTSQTGSFSFTAKVTDTASHSASQAFLLAVSAPNVQPPPGTSGYDGPAQLPQVYIQSLLQNTPSPGAVTQVPVGGSLQTALNNANCGDTIELAAGATFTGVFTLPAKACDNLHWITIRTSAPDTSLPPEGSRMTPCYGGVSSLPGRPSFNCSSPSHALASVVYSQVAGSGPFKLAPGANHYRLLGLEISRAAGTGFIGPLVVVQSGGTADHIILDRVWVHGSLQDDTQTGVNLNGMNYAAVINSYFDDFHCTSITGSCTDSHAVSGGTSSTADGPFQINGNFLEASTEAILFGGGYAKATPADIEIRHNHFFKPLTWLQGQAGFVGGPTGNAFTVKNHLELKNAQRVLIEGNIFENTWGGFSQNGYSILLTPKNQASGPSSNICPICETTDVTIRYNTLTHAGAGISMANVTSDNGGIAQAGERYSIHDVTIDDIEANLLLGSGTLFQVLSGWPTNPLNSISINHVTGFPDPNSRIMGLGNGANAPPMYNFVFKNSIIGQSKYPIWSTGGLTNCAHPDVPLPSLNACFPGGYTYSTNAIIGTPSAYPPASWPAGNYFPSSASSTQFANFNNGIGGDYTLLSSSPYKNAGTDGKDLGADISAIQSAIAGVY